MNISTEELKALKKIELEILDEFIRICNKHGLTYVLAGGTCLGAIRHHGFIPWDDDIDVSMPRADFDRFTELVPTELNDKYVFQSLDTEPNCGLVFGKIRKKQTVLSEDYSYHLPISQGIWIDIFPYDSLPNDKLDQKHLVNKVSLLKNLYIIKCGYKMPEGKSTVERLAYYVAKILLIPIPLSYLIKILNKTMRSYQNQPSKWIYPFGGAYSLDVEKLPEEMIQNTTEVSFENRKCKTFAQYDRYLTDHYGDYMQLPSIDKRHAGMHHVHELAL